MQSLLDVPAVGTTTIHGEGASGEEPPSDTRILLLAAVPYIAGVATHVVNGMHSHRVHERRWVLSIVQAAQSTKPAAVPAGCQAGHAAAAKTGLWGIYDICRHQLLEGWSEVCCRWTPF